MCRFLRDPAELIQTCIQQNPENPTADVENHRKIFQTFRGSKNGIKRAPVDLGYITKTARSTIRLILRLEDLNGWPQQNHLDHVGARLRYMILQLS